jgi:membrane protease YdiL (CAAX protease family)
LASPVAAWCFVAVRLLGLVVLVPVAEELFWRGFLLRWIASPD